jgi:ribosomal protein S12 methylthiotransferase
VKNIASDNSVYFVSLGCSKNLVDSEVMLGELGHAGYRITSKPEEAKVIVVNTCSFIDIAKEESIETILTMSDFKKEFGNKGQCEVLTVAGCMPQRYSTELAKELPEVDLFIGTGEYQNIVKYLKESMLNKLKSEQGKGFEFTPAVYVGVPKFIHQEFHHRTTTTEKYTVWLKVSEGCDRKCTFCVIPNMRGALRSRTVDSLVIEAKQMVANGVKEFNLISQDLSSYGIDLEDKDNLYNLLEALVAIEGLEWVRLFYHYPEDLDEKLMALMARSPKICSYLDMPVQHFSDRILKRMNRRVTGAEILRKVGELRKHIPNVVIRTSVIVGFPGETEEDLQELIEGIKAVKFDHMGVFSFSDEEEAPSYKLKGKNDSETISERQKEIYAIQKELVIENNQKYLGKTIKVLVEGLHEETELLLKGRHQGQAPDIDGKVIINEGTAKKGDIVDVEITDFFEYDLVGKIV